MKLSPIDIEKALEQSAAAPAMVVEPLPMPNFAPGIWEEFQKQMPHLMPPVVLGWDIGKPSFPGQVEQDLRAALKLLGEHGQQWTKGALHKQITKPRRVRVIEPFKVRPMMLMDNTLEGYESPAYECKIIDVPAGYSHCTIGAMGAVIGEPDMERVDNMIEAFCSANVIGDGIPAWNDHGNRKWSHVKQAFERAIDYAHRRGL